MVRTAAEVVGRDVDEILARDLPWERLAGTTVLVTGASGMLPSYVVRTLLALNDQRDAGIRVVGLVRDEARARSVLGALVEHGDLELLVQDVSSPIVVAGGIDHVVHGASPAQPARHAVDPVGTLKANVLGTLNLLDLCVEHGSAGMVLMSSAEVYGAQPEEGPALIDEQSYGGLDILVPRACYSEGKRAAETACAVYGAQHGLRNRVVRFGHVYGPAMAADDGRVQADFAAAVVAGRDIVLNSDGSAVRTYTYVGDAVAGLFYAMLLAEEMALNVADPRGLVSIRELAELFTRVRPDRGLQLSFAHEADRRAFSPARRQGLSSARLSRLGWRPLVDLPDGLDRMVTALEDTGARGRGGASDPAGSTRAT